MVVVGVFASDVLVVVMLAVALGAYFVFNVKMCWARVPILQSLFVVPCVAAFLPVFFGDLDMRT